MDESATKGLELKGSDDMDATRSEIDDVLSERCSCKEKQRCAVLNFFKGLRLKASEVEGIIDRSKDTEDSSKEKSELCDMFTLLKGLELHGSAPARKPPATWQEVDARVPFDPWIAALSLTDKVKFSRCAGVSVEGYNILLPVDRVKDDLRTHFLACGEICDVVIPFTRRTYRISDHCGVIYFWEESAVDKALALCGTDVGEWKVIVKLLPKKVCELSTDQVTAALKDLHSQHSRLVSFHVTGYNKLHDDEVKSALFKLFSPCGEITALNIFKASQGLSNKCQVCIWGDGALEKAKELSGSDVGGWKAVVRIPEPKPMEGNLEKDTIVGRIGWSGPPREFKESLKAWDGTRQPAHPNKKKNRKRKKKDKAAE